MAFFKHLLIKKNLLNNNAFIYENSVIGPDVQIGNTTIIMSGCIINNTLLGENCIIQPGVIIGTRLGITNHREDNSKVFELKLDQEDISSISTITSKSNDLFDVIGDCGSEYR